MSVRKISSPLIFCLIVSHILVAGDQRCNFLGDENEGWKCNRGDCLPKDWICDGEVQCQLPDRSDEEEGCNLFPLTGCKSWYGKRHFKCSNSGKCVSDEKECEMSGQLNVNNSFCPDGLYEQWRCSNGMCIPKNLTCDGIKHCTDGTDETEGCSLFPEKECKSWYGQQHIVCPTSNETICTLPKFSHNCRECDNKKYWRCDDGFCIPMKNVHDGIVHCKDGSDESAIDLRLWNVFLLTIIIASTGVGMSFLFRIVRAKKSFFDCVFCRSRKTRAAHEAIAEMDMLDAIKITDDSKFPIELIDLFENEENWRKEVTYCLTTKADIRAQKLYSIIHRDPVIYKNLYHYLFYRYGTPSKLKRCTDQLFRWEKDFHCQNNFEALACWRLHLGSCDVLRKVIKSIQPEGFVSKFFDWFQPKRNFIRQKLRSCTPQYCKSGFEMAYKVWNTGWYLIKPFFGASFFYFDLIKDLVLSILICKSINDISGHVVYQESPFEICLEVALIAVQLITQFIFAWISFQHSNQVFEMCEHSASTSKKRLFKLLSVLFAPIMPAFLLANYVYYRQKRYGLQRKLETLEESEECGESLKQDVWAKKITLFQEIENMRFQSSLHQRIYSFFRVSAAVVQSFNMIVAIILIVVVSKNRYRNGEESLFARVAHKVGEFMGMNPNEESIISSFDIAMDIVVIVCVLYSVIMIISALLRYVYQSKTLSLTFGGKLCLSLFFTAHLASRLTIFIALFSTAEETSQTEPSIPLLPSAILGFTIFFVHGILIFWFKRKFVKGFQSVNSLTEKIVHVLANTIVVIPFIPWEFEYTRFKKSMQRCPERSRSFPPATQKAARWRKGDSSLDGSIKFDSASSPTENIERGMCHKDFNILRPILAAPSLLANRDLPNQLIQFWWENPRRKLTIDNVKERLNKKSTSICDFKDDTLEMKIKELEHLGLINKNLRNPQKTKMEYFWLFSFHFLASCTAFTIEIANGGTYTTSGIYYSWDVRLSTFVLGLIFLLLYYKRYHVLHDITSSYSCCSFSCFKIIFCYLEQAPLKAIPELDELRSCLHRSEEDVEAVNKLTVDVMTQTSINAQESKENSERK